MFDKVWLVHESFGMDSRVFGVYSSRYLANRVISRQEYPDSFYARVHHIDKYKNSMSIKV